MDRTNDDVAPTSPIMRLALLLIALSFPFTLYGWQSAEHRARLAEERCKRTFEHNLKTEIELARRTEDLRTATLDHRP